MFQNTAKYLQQNKSLRTLLTVAKMVFLAYNIEEASLTAETNSTISNKKDHDLDILMYEIKKKISVADSYCHKMQMLTLTPESWTHKKIQIALKCLSILFELQDKLKMSNEQGILSLPGKNFGNPISPETVKLVTGLPPLFRKKIP